MSNDEVISRTRLLDNEIKIMRSEIMRISHELQTQKEKNLRKYRENQSEQNPSISGSNCY